MANILRANSRFWIGDRGTAFAWYSGSDGEDLYTPVKRRLIVLTDPNVDPALEGDDAESLVRLMSYANHFDIEGLVATVSHNLNYRYTEPIYTASEAYGSVLSNLEKHEGGWPSQASIESVIGLGPDSVGTNYALTQSSCEGSDIIVRALNKVDDRPIWVAIFGDGAVLAQALEYIASTTSSAAAQTAAAKLRVYDIAGQDDSGAWLKDAAHYPDLFYMRTQFGHRSMDEQSEVTHPGEDYARGPGKYTSDLWVANNIQNHGALGAVYPDRVWLKEGDTPSILHIMENGFADPEQPWQGGWGLRYGRETETGIRSYRDPLDGTTEEMAETWFDPYYMYGPDNDAWVSASGETFNNIYSPLYRHWKEFQNDFAARMDWGITSSYSGANHPPEVVLNGDSTSNVLYQSASAGEIVSFSAVGTTDPDGDNLSYLWWNYGEAGTYAVSQSITSSTSTTATIKLPQDITADTGSEFHIMLQVEDDGTPPLTRYRRLVINASGSYTAPTSSYREDIMYLFENGNSDETGTYDFTNTGMTYVTTPSIPEGTYAGYSNGGSTYFTLPSSYTDNFPDDFTIMFWHRTPTDTYQVMIVEAQSMSTGFAIRLNTGGTDFDVWTDGVECNATNYASPVINTWFHYAVDYKSSTGLVHIHVNGVNKTDGGGETGDTNIGLTGAWAIMDGGTGYIDDFRIFPEILSTADILSIKNNPGTPFNEI